MTKDNPLKIKDPIFKCSPPREYALEAEIAISDPASGYKSDRFSTLCFRTDQMGGYEMKLAFRQANSEDWFSGAEMGEICIQFAGDYEAHTLEEFFQHVGNMLTVTHGKLAIDEEE